MKRVFCWEQKKNLQQKFFLFFFLSISICQFSKVFSSVFCFLFIIIEKNVGFDKDRFETIQQGSAVVSCWFMQHYCFRINCCLRVVRAAVLTESASTSVAYLISVFLLLEHIIQLFIYKQQNYTFLLFGFFFEA